MKFLISIILIFSTIYSEAQITISKSSVGLSSVDNTSDKNKPVSLSQETRILRVSDSLKKVYSTTSALSANISNLSLNDGKLSATDLSMKKTIDSLINVIALMKKDTIVVKARIDSIWNGTSWVKFQ